MTSLIAALLLISPACCAEPKAPSEPIQVVVLVILASDQNENVHERIREIAAEIRKKSPQLKSFDLHRTISKMIRLGESIPVEVIDNVKIDLTLNEKTDDEGRVTMTVKTPKLDEITYACTCGKFFPIITNHVTEDKHRLIIAIMAKPCKKK